jgi:ketosteroid isomerase-like protein
MNPHHHAASVMDAFGAAFKAGDIVALESLYTPDAVVWHNHNNIETLAVQNMQVLSWIVTNTASRSYQDVRRWLEVDSMVEQHTVVMTLHNGEEIRCPACIIVQLNGDRISRIEEYIDPAPFARLATG